MLALSQKENLAYASELILLQPLLSSSPVTGQLHGARSGVQSGTTRFRLYTRRHTRTQTYISQPPRGGELHLPGAECL